MRKYEITNKNISPSNSRCCNGLFEVKRIKILQIRIDYKFIKELIRNHILKEAPLVVSSLRIVELVLREEVKIQILPLWITAETLLLLYELKFSICLWLQQFYLNHVLLLTTCTVERFSKLTLENFSNEHFMSSQYNGKNNSEHFL